MTSTSIAKPDATAAEAVDLLAATDLFRGCSREDIEAVARCTRFRHHAAGADVFREGEDSQEQLVLWHGEIAFLKRAEDGRAHEVLRVASGEGYGEVPLLDPGRHSATVRAITAVDALVIPVEDLDRLIDERPRLAHAMLAIARRQAHRLETANMAVAETLGRALGEEHTRTNMGRFIFMVIVTYSLYTWVLGTAAQAKAALGHSEYVTIPGVIVVVAILITFMKRSGYPASFFGLTLRGWRRDAPEAVLLTLPLMFLAVLIKLWMIGHIGSMRGEPIFQVLHHSYLDGIFNPWLLLGYLAFVPLQELVYRGGLQGALEHFFSGPNRRWAAIFTSNVIFSAGHLYISVGLSVAALLAGLFWGWLYQRQRGLLGVTLSHILLGLWVFEVVDLGPLE